MSTEKADNALALNMALYKKMCLIRFAEEAIIEYYGEDEMKTPMHMSMGEEAVVTGCCHALSDNDQVLGTYRSHALFLAKTQNVNTFFAEMYGKSTGTADGKSGSMHLSDPAKGMMLSSAIVASSISTATGVALANKMKKNGNYTAVFFGDGAVDAGTFWESVNYACLMKLPILFVLEDNGIAVHTEQDARYGYSSIEAVLANFDCDVYTSESTDVEEIYQLVESAKTSIKESGRPAFLKLKYYRYLEHVGINYDFHDNYRDRNEFEQWKKRDPISLQRHKLIHQLNADESELQAIERAIREQVQRGVHFAKESPLSDIQSLHKDVYQ